jgi:hypothetical protein
MRTLYLILLLCTILGCSKKNQSAQIPANSTTIALDVSFPDGHSVNCVDYSVPVSNGSVSQLVDGATDTLFPVGWVNSKNVQAYGFNYWEYAFMGLSAGKNYSLIFCTPTWYNNNLYSEINGPNVSYSLSYATGSSMKFQFQGSTYEMTSAYVTTNVADSNAYDPINGTFIISFYADSVFTATTRTAYSYATPIVINGTFQNVTY